MPPKAAPPPAPARGVWASTGRNHLAFTTGGAATQTYAQAAAYIQQVAYLLLTRTNPNAVQPVINFGGLLNMNHYQVWYILDKEVADEFRRLLAMASVRIFYLTRIRLLTSCSLLSVVSPSSSFALLDNARTMPSGRREDSRTRVPVSLPLSLVPRSLFSSFSLAVTRT